jgi:hypothetical protein
MPGFLYQTIGEQDSGETERERECERQSIAESDR